MSLHSQAQQDIANIMADTTAGPGLTITLKNPDGKVLSFSGLANDIGYTIDPNTGLTVSGRQASFSVQIASLTAAGFDVPRNITKSSERPWICTFTAIDGVSRSYKITDVAPDRSVDMITCQLEIIQ